MEAHLEWFFKMAEKSHFTCSESLHLKCQAITKAFKAKYNEKEKFAF